MAAGALNPDNERQFQAIVSLWRSKLIEAQDSNCDGRCHPEAHLKNGVLQNKKLVSELTYKN